MAYDSTLKWSHTQMKYSLLIFFFVLVCFLNFLKAQPLSYSEDSKIAFKTNLAFQYGGESKLTLLPKLNFVRIHQVSKIKPYYGLEFGIHPLFVSSAFTFACVAGIEYKPLILESSLSHFRTTKVNNENGDQSGPFSQNSVNLKLGYSINKITIKIGTSFLLSESIPEGDDRIPLLDLGKVNNAILGIELQVRIN